MAYVSTKALTVLLGGGLYGSLPASALAAEPVAGKIPPPVTLEREASTPTAPIEAKAFSSGDGSADAITWKPSPNTLSVRVRAGAARWPSPVRVQRRGARPRFEAVGVDAAGAAYVRDGTELVTVHFEKQERAELPVARVAALGVAPSGRVVVVGCGAGDDGVDSANPVWVREAGATAWTAVPSTVRTYCYADPRLTVGNDSQALLFLSTDDRSELHVAVGDSTGFRPPLRLSSSGEGASTGGVGLLGGGGARAVWSEQSNLMSADIGADNVALIASPLPTFQGGYTRVRVAVSASGRAAAAWSTSQIRGFISTYGLGLAVMNSAGQWSKPVIDDDLAAAALGTAVSQSDTSPIAVTDAGDAVLSGTVPGGRAVDDVGIVTGLLTAAGRWSGARVSGQLSFWDPPPGQRVRDTAATPTLGTTPGRTGEVIAFRRDRASTKRVKDRRYRYDVSLMPVDLTTPPTRTRLSMPGSTQSARRWANTGKLAISCRLAKAGSCSILRVELPGSEAKRLRLVDCRNRPLPPRLDSAVGAGQSNHGGMFAAQAPNVVGFPPLGRKTLESMRCRVPGYFLRDKIRASPVRTYFTGFAAGYELGGTIEMKRFKVVLR